MFASEPHMSAQAIFFTPDAFSDFFFFTFFRPGAKIDACLQGWWISEFQEPKFDLQFLIFTDGR